MWTSVLPVIQVLSAFKANNRIESIGLDALVGAAHNHTHSREPLRLVAESRTREF